MRVLIEKPFRSAKYKRILLPGETVNGTKEWAEAIEKAGLGKIIEEASPKVQKRVKKVLGREVETASVEPK